MRMVKGYPLSEKEKAITRNKIYEGKKSHGLSWDY